MLPPLRPGLRLCLQLTAVLVSALLLLAAPWPVVRLTSGVLLLFLLPGYLLTRFLWPHSGQVPGLWRLGLILPGSMALLGGLLLLLAYSWGYRPRRVVLLLVILSGMLAVSGYLRRRHMPPAEAHRPGRPLAVHVPPFNLRLTGRHALLGLAAAALLASILYAIATPRETPAYTEFYVLAGDGHLPLIDPGAGGLAAGLQYGILNHEGRAVDYRLLVVAHTPQRRLVLSSQTVTVADRSAVQAPLNLSALPATSSEILLFLFRDDPAVPYRSLRLRVY